MKEADESKPLSREQILIVRDRIKSLEANRKTLEILLGIVVAIYPLLVKLAVDNPPQGIILPWWVLDEILVFSAGAGILLVSGILAISDSIHFYTKFEEYHDLWYEGVHGRAYPSSGATEKSQESFRQALEADNIGYHRTRFAILLAMAAVLVIPVSRIVTVVSFYIATTVPSRIGDPAGMLMVGSVFFVSFLVPLYALVMTYKASHSYIGWRKLVSRFLRARPVIKKGMVLVDEQLSGWAKTHDYQLRTKFDEVRVVGNTSALPKGISDKVLAEYCRKEKCYLLTSDRTSYVEFLNENRRSIKIIRYGWNESSKQRMFLLDMLG